MSVKLAKYDDFTETYIKINGCDGLWIRKYTSGIFEVCGQYIINANIGKGNLVIPFDITRVELFLCTNVHYNSADIFVSIGKDISKNNMLFSIRDKNGNVPTVDCAFQLYIRGRWK